MLYSSVQSFIEDYRNEAAGTQKLLDALTDASLAQEIAPGYRTLGFLAWHLATAGGMLLQTGLKFAPPSEDSNPNTAAGIAQGYRNSVEAVIDAVQSQFTDETLQQTANMFGSEWKIGLALGAFINHEIHHRGQLTILMRQAGVPVAGVYGPSKDEWAAMGVPAPN